MPAPFYYPGFLDNIRDILIFLQLLTCKCSDNQYYRYEYKLRHRVIARFIE